MTLSKQGNEVTGYVVREGVREDAEEELGSVGEPAKDASSGASDAKGAAIAAASGVPAPSHADAGVIHVPSLRDQFRIARADLARMTEQRDASTERERGLAAKLEAVREAAR